MQGLIREPEMIGKRLGPIEAVDFNGCWQFLNPSGGLTFSMWFLVDDKKKKKTAFVGGFFVCKNAIRVHGANDARRC